MGKFKDFWTNLGSSDDRYEDDNYEEELEEGQQAEEAEEAEEAPVQKTRAVRPSRNDSQVIKRAGNIETIKPASYSDAHKIIEKLREGSIIVFSLELVDDELALRILDFVYGGTFALSGKIKEVGTRVYVVTNYGVNLTDMAGANDQQKPTNYR